METPQWGVLKPGTLGGAPGAPELLPGTHKMPLSYKAKGRCSTLPSQYNLTAKERKLLSDVRHFKIFYYESSIAMGLH